MTWNYRVVKFDGAFDEPYFEIKEVYYDRDGNPTGYCDATVAGETFEDIITVLDQMKADATRAVLMEKEFYRVEKREEL
jgi:hypothetical protein